MKHHVLLPAAAAVTAISLPVNLPAVAAGQAGPLALSMTLAVAGLWLAAALVCTGRTAAMAAIVFFPGITLLAVGVLSFPIFQAMPAARLAWMLAQAPLYGFMAISGGPAEALALATAFCVLVAMLGCLIFRRARHGPADREAFGSGSALPGQPEYPTIDRMVFRRAGRVRPRR